MKVKDVISQNMLDEVKRGYENDLYAYMTANQARALTEMANDIAAGKYEAYSYVNGLEDNYNLEVRTHKECRTKNGDLFTRMICTSEDGKAVQVNYFRNPSRRVSRWQPEYNRR